MRLRSIVLSGLAAAALAASVAAPASADNTTTHTVKFAAGASSATVKGTVKGYDTVNYMLGAAGGQVMQVLFEPSNNACYFNVIAPGADSAMFMGETAGNEFSGTLPSDGDYRVEVYLMRSAARRNEVCNFSVTFEITG